MLPHRRLHPGLDSVDPPVLPTIPPRGGAGHGLLMEWDWCVRGREVARETRSDAERFAPYCGVSTNDASDGYVILTSTMRVGVSGPGLILSISDVSFFLAQNVTPYACDRIRGGPHDPGGLQRLADSSRPGIA